MSNHIHLIAGARNDNLSDILRDFNKFTGRQLIKAIQTNEQESRREPGCLIFSGIPEKLTAEMACFSFGGRIISQKNYIALRLFFRS